MADFFDEAADVASGEEEEEEEFNEDGNPIPRAPRKNGDMNDSSEEEEDDDEEAAREVQEGFIVDEDEEDPEERRRRRRERKKRRREEQEEEEELDADDMDLIGLGDGEERVEQKSKYKRLKRGHREERAVSEARGVEDIFSDDEEGGVDGAPARPRGGFGYGDEMDDFIEQDEFADEEGERMREDLEIRQPSKAGFADLQNLKESGIDEADLEDMRGAFGDGNEFEWALEVEKEINAEEIDPEKPLELKDVFEPSQLIEKMLTDDDNAIRVTDVPERFQLARKPYRDLSDLSDEEQTERAAEEAHWVANLMFPRQRLGDDLREPFEQAVAKVLYFMNVEDFEPAFIFQNRKDYLIHSEQVPRSPDPGNPNAPDYEIKAVKLLNQTNIWEVFDYDLKFRAFAEKRDGIRRNVQYLRDTIEDFGDPVFDDLLPHAEEVEELQDIQDYLNFQYSSQLRDMSTVEAETNGTQKRARGTRNIWERVRAGPPYHLVRAFGLTADAYAQNVSSKIGNAHHIDDPEQHPDDMADTLVQDPEYRTGRDVLKAATAMFVEELAQSPRLRRHLRTLYIQHMVFDVVRTDKGLKQIDAEHPYYEFKYMRNQEVRAFGERPELYLRMLRAEADGLVEIKVRLQNERRIREDLQKSVESSGTSEIADAWNGLRRQVLDLALKKLHRVITKGWKEHLQNECENKIAHECREEYSKKLDQAPLKPKGMMLGTTPRVLALSNGAGNRADAICWAYVDEGSRVLENGKFTDLRLGNPEKFLPDGKDVAAFVELAERRKPDVVAVSGWSVETRRLYKDLQDVIERHELRGPVYEDEDEDREVSDPLEVAIVNDEVARLYHTSERANVDHPGMPPLTRYAIALAMYMQNPLKEYAALGRDITSITFDPNQHLIPEEKLLKYLETAMVDMVNLVGIDINEAVNDPSIANLLPYVCGLGPRKAAQMLKVINSWGGDVGTRDQLVGDPERGLKPAVGPKCWVNCASFLYVVYEATENDTDYLDNTRIHPEDYDIARKIAADALEFDEEDIKTEVDQNGPAAVVRKLIADDAQEKVNDLLLEQYAEQLESKFGQRKRATLETIRAELQNPYEELRRNFTFLNSNEVFTMLTGETQDSLQEKMVVPVQVRRTFGDHIEVRLDCGVDGSISVSEFPEDVANSGLEPRQVWQLHQTLRAKITHLDRKKLAVQLTMREAELRNPFRRQYYHGMDEWDEDQEARDMRDSRRATQKEAGRIQRVVKHSLFRQYNSSQAEAELASQNRGDCVIRGSSKGADHLAVTWKVHDGVYQHLDVLELDKENEFSLGKVLRVGKVSYSDLDELIVGHVKAMAKKVDEMCGDERFQSGTKQQTEQWLTTYTEANPKRSMYAFCLNTSYPGYFHLCFKMSERAPCAAWPVKVIPSGFELQGNKYPDMRALKNGFKLLCTNHGAQGAGRGRGGR